MQSECGLVYPRKAVMLYVMRRFLPACVMMALQVAEAGEMPPPPMYVCQRTQEPIVVDGVGEERSWKQAHRLCPMRDIEGASVKDDTLVKMLWDDDYLYVLADMKETHLWATKKERDSVIFHDPDFEVFIDPDGDSLNYVEIEINAFNSVWDLLLTAPYRNNGLALHDWNIPGLKHAVHLKGSLNQPNDEDAGWSVELAIPWKSLIGHSSQPRHTEPPAAGTVIRMNYSRVNWRVQPDAQQAHGYSKCKDVAGNILPESNHVWAPTGVVNIHHPEKWGYVKLSEKPVGSGFESMTPPAHETALKRLHAYANAQHSHRVKTGCFDTRLRHDDVRVLSLNPEYFVVQTYSPCSGQTLTLDSRGSYVITPVLASRPPLYVWVQGNKHQGDEEWWQQHFSKLAEAGIYAVIIGGDSEQIAALTPLAAKQGLQVYAWLWALNRPEDAVALQHPDWYAVNRCGRSCHVPGERPYVPYYQFLCPNHEAVLHHLLQEVDKLAAIPGLAGIQLDYMRLPDVILPRGLWEKYGLMMETELPEYDYCYCPRCQRAFAQEYGRPVSPHPDKDEEWREFRLNSVARVANALSERIRAHYLRSACAVFPTPAIACQLVRQDWSRFNVDLALPMAYFSFYDEAAEWVAKVSREATEQTCERIPVAPGLHLPDCTPDQIHTELNRLLRTSPSGIGLFCDEQLTPAMLNALRDWNQKDPEEAQ